MVFALNLNMKYGIKQVLVNISNLTLIIVQLYKQTKINTRIFSKTRTKLKKKKKITIRNTSNNKIIYTSVYKLVVQLKKKKLNKIK